MLAWVLLAVGLVAAVPAAPTGAAPAQAPPNYSNWLFNGDNPSIMKTGTAQAPVYYAYIGGFDFGPPIGARVFRSTDLATWQSVGDALPVATAGNWANRSSGWNFSSPSVREIGTNPASERYVMYFTGINATTGEKCIGVATSSAPAGPFVGKPNPLICGAQDPSAVLLPDGLGFQEVAYRKTSGPDAGAIFNQVLTENGQAFHATWTSPFLLYRPMPNWWHEGIVDRPQLVGDGAGNAYLFFGGGTPNTTGRATGWAPCTALGIVVSCQNQTVLGSWFEGTSQVKAVGGVQTFLDAQGNNWMVYRGQSAAGCPPNGGTCTGTPNVYLDRLCFSHGFPRTNAPTTGSQSTARNTNCGNDIPAPALSVASVDDGNQDPAQGTTLVSQTGQPIYLDGMSTAAMGGKVLWTFGDTFCPGGNSYSKTAGFGVPHALAEGPNFVEHQCDVFLPLTADEAAYQAAHATCTPPPGGQCEQGRFVFWGPVIGLPDGSGIAIFSKVWMYRIRQSTGELSGESPRKLGVGLARIPAASIAAGNPEVDRSRTVSPNACNPVSDGGATAAGCLFDESVAPTNSDRFWRPYIEGGYLYLFSDFSWEGGTGNTKLARAPLGDIHNKQAWLYWKGPGPNDYAATYDQAADVPGLLAGSLSFNPYLNKYINGWGDLGGGMEIQTADSLTGPWSARQPLHNQVECPGGYSYAGGLHPELASDGGRILNLTYIQVNNGTCAGKTRMATINLG